MALYVPPKQITYPARIPKGSPKSTQVPRTGIKILQTRHCNAEEFVPGPKVVVVFLLEMP